MNCEKLCGKITTGVFIGIISAFFLLIMGQFVIKNIFIEVFHMDNFITDWSVTGGSDGMVDIDWKAMYPFEEQIEDASQDTATHKTNFLLAKARSVMKVVDMYSNDYLPFKEYVKIPSGAFDRLIDNRMVDTDNVYMRTGKDGLIVRSPFYLDYTEEELDTRELVSSVKGLSDYLKESGIEFMYVQAPIKEDKYDEEYISEYGLSYENRLADNLMDGLKEEGIDVLDLRKELYDDGMDCYDSFFVTDNHWNIQTAFWATGVIADKLNRDYGFNFDMDLFDTANYDEHIYKRWVQGTIGRSVTLVNADYDDISVFEPKFETNLTVRIPSLNMDKTGSYVDTMINPAAFKRRSTVYHGAYDAFAYSKPPVTEVTNNIKNDNEGKSVLLLRESFAGPVITYMSLGVEKLYALTPEGFTGSIESYIKEVNPDIVVVLYTAPTTNKITSKYDFK